LLEREKLEKEKRKKKSENQLDSRLDFSQARFFIAAN
jgi:hypothetical protein